MLATPTLLLLIVLALAIGRALVWIVNLLLVSPLFDPLRKLPGADASFFTSHIKNVVDPDLSATQHAEWKKRYGKTFRYQGAGRFDYRLMSFDLRVVSHVLSSPIYEKPKATRSFISSMLGKGIFTTEGPEHTFQKKIIGPAFTLQSVKTLTPIFTQKAEELRDKWDELLSSSEDSISSHSEEEDLEDKPIDVYHWISRATFDAFGLACLTYNFGAIHGETEDVYLAYRRMFDMADRKTIWRILIPLLDTIWPDEVATSIKASRKTIYSVGRKLIAVKKAAILSEKQSLADNGEKDLLSLLIKSNLSNDPTKRLSDSDLLDQISSFFFSGSDTTALGLSWCLHFLARYPDAQTRLRDELKSLSKSGASTYVKHRAYDALDSFPYLDAVVRESLRLIPPVHGTLRMATSNDLIPVSEPVLLRNRKVVYPGEHIHIRRGSVIHIPIEGLNFAREIWGDDSLEFRPDRWRNLPSSARPPNFPGLANLMTFSFGPSSCPGYRFTITEMKAFLSILVPHYTFHPAEGQDIGKRNGIFTRPFVRGDGGLGLPLTVKRIDSSS